MYLVLPYKTFVMVFTLCHSAELSEGYDTSKMLYEVSKIYREKILRILRILEDSGDSLGIPGDS